MGDQAKAVDVEPSLAHGSVARQRTGEHHDIVIVSEPLFHQVQRSDISTHFGVSVLDQPQRIPERFDRLTPLMETIGSRILARALHRLPPAAMRGADATGERAGVAVCRPPTLRDSMNHLKLAFDILPPPVLDVFRDVPFSIDKLLPDLRERGATEQPGMSFPERR